jgi:GH25 family lysozyme M1 (1,4-beta-N-acetylmuramidase)
MYLGTHTPSTGAPFQVPVNGIDVSHWNGDPDLDYLAENPWLKLYGMKASHVGGAGMVNDIDPYLKGNHRQAKHIESVRWRMHFAFIHGSASPLAQVEALARAVDSFGGLQEGDGLYIDWETPTSKTHPQVVATRAQLDDVLALVDAEWPNRWAVYANDVSTEMTAFVNEADDLGIPLWFPDYSQTAGLWNTRKVRATVWQTSNSGTVPGFPGPIDLNYVLRPELLDLICDAPLF